MSLNNRDCRWVPGRWRSCDQELGGKWPKNGVLFNSEGDIGRLVVNGRSVETQALVAMLVGLCLVVECPATKRVWLSNKPVRSKTLEMCQIMGGGHEATGRICKNLNSIQYQSMTRVAIMLLSPV